MRRGVQRTVTFLVLVAAGCGSGDSEPDAAVATGDFQHYVQNMQLVPRNNTEANMFGLDLDDAEPTRVDNDLGIIFGVLAMQGLSLQGATDDAIASGQLLHLHSVRAESLTDAVAASWQVYLGAETPPPYFNGSDTFALASDSPLDAVLQGTIVAGRFTGGPGSLTIRLAIVPGDAPITVRLIGARIVADVTADGCMNGKIGGAIGKDDVDAELIPALASAIDWIVENDAGCQMVPPMCGESAQVFLDSFDKGITCAAANEALVCPTEAPTCGPDPDGGAYMKCGCGMPSCMGSLPGDGEISVAEVANSSLTKSLLAPDVDLLDAAGVFQENPRDRDGVKDSLSLGLGMSCVGATFTAPGE